MVEIEMRPLYKIKGYEGKKFRLLPIDGFDKKSGFAQGGLGDCFLIASIISMTNIPLIFHYIFQNSLKVNEYRIIDSWWSWKSNGAGYS
jgi:hypothetical protein